MMEAASLNQMDYLARDLDYEHNYFGYRTIQLDDEQLSEFYKDKNSINCRGFENNSYILIQHKQENLPEEEWKVVDEYKIRDGELIPLRYSQMSSKLLGTLAPKNPQQKLAFDLLQDPNTTIKFLTGVYGGGKTFLMVNMALEYIKKGTFQRIIWVRNNVEVKDSTPLGSLPGSVYDKLLPYCMPMADHCGGVEALEDLIAQNIIEIQHLGFMRGRDIHNSIILSSESENLTKEHVQLLIGRVGEGSNLWIEGDLRQTDKAVFRQNSGLAIGIDRLKGHDLFGYVHFPKTERSATAQLADLLD